MKYKVRFTFSLWPVALLVCGAATLVCYAVVTVPMTSQQMELPTSVAPVASIVVEPPMLDFGDVPVSTERQATVKLINNGTSVVALRGPRTSCSCLHAELPRATVNPGAAVEMTVRFFAGPDPVETFQQTVAFNFFGAGDLVGTWVTVPIKGRRVSAAPIRVFPTKLDLGTITRERRIERTLWVRGAPSVIAQFPNQIEIAGNDTITLNVLTTLDAGEEVQKAVALIIQVGREAQGQFRRVVKIVVRGNGKSASSSQEIEILGTVE